MRQKRDRDTGRLLLDAAAEVFAEHGFAGATMDDVAGHAGLTKGALYHRYRTKDDLIAALLADTVRTRSERLARILIDLFAEGASGGVHAQRVADELVAVLTGDRAWSGLLVEFAGRANRDPVFRDRVGEAMAGLRGEVAVLVRARAEAARTELPLPAEQVAQIVGALGNGLLLERVLNQDVPERLDQAAMSLLLSGVAVASRGRRP